MYIKPEQFNFLRSVDIVTYVVMGGMGRALMALSIANKAYVLETGRIVLEGDSKELLANDAVRSAYLGE